jgi:quercetin dioxygenase-like cupin family protein
MAPEEQVTRGRGTVAALVLAVALGGGAAGLAQQSQSPSPPAATDPYRSLAPRVKATLRFATDLPVTPGGPTFHVKVYTWHIAPQQDLPSFPLEGAATFEVRAGEVQTTIDGQTAERREGDHWAVPEGAQLRLKTGNDSVSLQGVVVVRR